MLLLIDVQRNMLEPPQPVPAWKDVSAAIATLLERARAAGEPVVWVRNNGGPGDPDVRGTRGWELVHEPAAGEVVIDKSVPDAFANTDLGDLLPPSSQVVVAGMQSEWCVRETSLTALALGHEVTLVRGAHATYDDPRPAHEVSLAVEKELSEAGGRVVEVDEVAF
ncbi:MULTISPECIES: isochorismatase family protein [Nonomuraea]|uniref:Nicotinamidase-related amidase n=2 Tax=Nonomuraea TaxID=83681 RepID=A0A7W5V6Y2_9ACTN|nr:isochorismatase family protein [Nonomuraea dietziae]MBB3730304.1 nicotinamidase-related amidase [Nonomuraea dietziae]